MARPVSHAHCSHNLFRLECQVPRCNRWFRNSSGLTQHTHSAHPNIHQVPVLGLPSSDHPPPPQSPLPFPEDFSPPPQSPAPPPDFSPPPQSPVSPPDFYPPPRSSPPIYPEPAAAPDGYLNDPQADAEFTDESECYYRTYHSSLNGESLLIYQFGFNSDVRLGRPCAADGTFLEPGTPPSPVPTKSPHDWSPYRNRIEFETAEFMFKRRHMSTGDLDFLLDLWAASLAKHNDSPPFADHKDLHKVIDATPLGDVPWQCFSVQYTGERPEASIPPWMDDEFDVWYRDPHAMACNMLANPNYKDEIDYTPFREYDASNDKRRWKDFMSGDWAWRQAVRL